MDYAELETYKAKMRIESGHLVITLHNLPGLMVYEIVHVYKNGNIYLGAHRISSGGGIKEYKIQISGYALPSDIKKHIYWVNPDSTVQLLHPKYLK